VDYLPLSKSGGEGFKGPRIPGFARKTSVEYMKMLYVKKGETGTAKKDIARIKRMLKAVIKLKVSKSLDPWTLFSN